MSHAKYHFDFLLVKNQNKCSSGILWVLKSTWCLRKGILQKLTISSAEADKFETEAKAWVTYFTSIYQSKNVTPYIHIMAIHIPEFIHKSTNLAQFNQQGMEKLNDQTTIDFARSTNHNYRNLEALKQLLYKENRMELWKIMVSTYTKTYKMFHL